MLQKTDLFYHQYLPEIKDEIAFRQYLNLVEFALIREKPEGYTEKHHIVPRCYFPKEYTEKTNKINNIVIFKANEHFIAHFYLKEAFKDNSQTIALMMLCNCKNRYHVTRDNFIKLSLEYEFLKKEYVKIVSKQFIGFKWFYNIKTNEHFRVNSKNIKFYENSKDFVAGYSPERSEKCKHFHSEETKNKISIKSKKNMVFS